MGTIYKDSQVSEIDYQYFQINNDNTASGFKRIYQTNTVYKVRFMENGAAATDEWKRLDKAYSDIPRILLLLVDVNTEEYYTFKQYKNVNNINHYIFYKLNYDVETNKIIYMEADLNTQDGATVLTTKEIPLGGAAVTYLGANGIEVADAAEENTKIIELEYGKTKELDFEVPLASKIFNITSNQTDYYLNSNDNYYTFEIGSILKIYTLDNNNNKVLIEDNPTVYQDVTGDGFYVGININENPYDSSTSDHITTYTKKDSNYISGILYIDGDRYFDTFYTIDGATVEKTISLIINKKASNIITIPQKMIPYGKNIEILLDTTGSNGAEITQKLSSLQPEEAFDYILQIYYDTKDEDMTFEETDSLIKVTSSVPWTSNNTLTENFIYNQNTIAYLNNEEELITAELESGDDATNNYFLDRISSLQLYKNSTDQYPINIGVSQDTIVNLKYYRYNITTSLTEIVSTKTWTVTNPDEIDNALLVLVTLKTGIQFWTPFFKKDETRHAIRLTLVNIKRPIVIKQEISSFDLPIINSSERLKDSEKLLTGDQIHSYVEGRLSSFSPSVNLALQITDKGDDANKPVINYVLANKFTEIQDSLDQKVSSTDLNNAVTNLQIDYQTQVNNKPTIPTAASIQATMAYDSAPTQDSENLVKSKDLYIVQKNLIEQIGGKVKGYVFDTNAELQAWLTDENKAKLKVGDVLYIKDTGYPDYWWDGTSTQYLETQKVDLTDYAKTADVASTYLTKADARINYKNKNEYDFRTFIKKATISTDNNTTLTNTKNSCVEISLQDNESLSNFYSFEDREEYYCPITILKVYQDSNLNISCYTFSFNAQETLYSGYLTFLPSDAPEGTYRGSDSYLVTLPNGANNYRQFFLQAWVYASTTVPKLYLKRTDFTPLA